MSLKEAVLEIAELTDEEAEHREGDNRRILLLVGRMIRNAVKAAGDAPAPATPMYQPEEAAAQHRLMIEKAKAEFRLKPLPSEERGEAMVLMVDGPLANTTCPMHLDAPVGTRVNVAGHSYVLRVDGRLYEQLDHAGLLPLEDDPA